MAIGLRSTSTNTSNSADTLSVSAPSGTTTGDVVLVIATRNSAASDDLVVDNNGSTPFTRDATYFAADNGFSMNLFTRRIVGGDPSSYSFNFTNPGATRFTLIAIAWSGPHATDIYDATPSFSYGTAITSIDSNSVTASIANGYHLIVTMAEGGDQAWDETTPSSYTKLHDGDAFNAATTVWYRVVGSGSTGTKTLTASSSSEVICASMIFKNTISDFPIAANSGSYIITGTQAILRPGSRTILKYRK